MRLEQCARSATVFVMITERRSLPRFFAAAPDALTAGLYLLAWIAPATLGPDKVKALLLGMFIEFLVMHSSIAFEGIDGDPKSARATRLWRLAGLMLFMKLDAGAVMRCSSAGSFIFSPIPRVASRRRRAFG